MFLFIFCLVLSIMNNVVLKSQTIIRLFLPSFPSVFASYIWRFVIMSINICNCVIFLLYWTFYVNIIFVPEGSEEMEALEVGGGIGQGDHFLPDRFIERSFEHWANSTEQLLNVDRGHQVPRKVVHGLWKDVGQNIKDKKIGTRVRDGDPSSGGSCKRREVSKH